MSWQQREDLVQVLNTFSDVLIDRPGQTDLETFSVRLIDNTAIQCRPYPVPESKLDVIKTEVEKMLNLGIIEPASSGYSLPIVLVAKKDKTHRFCVNYWKLNRVTEPEIEMIPDPDIIFARVAIAEFFSKMDLSKDSGKLK